MRVLMATNTYLPARNGVAVWVGMAVRELRERGHEVGVLTYAHPRRAAGESALYAVPAWAGLDPDFRVAPVPRRLPEGVERPWDIVHVHHPILLGPRAADVARRRGAKVVFSCHSAYTEYLEEYGGGAGRLFVPALGRRVARFVDGCDVALASSTYISRWLAGLGVTAPVELLEAPADTRRVPPLPRDEARRSLGLAPEDRVALYVGRIAPEKCVNELVDAFAAVVGRVPRAVLALVGDGTAAPAVARHASRLGLADRVRLLSAVDGPGLGAWYSAADIHVSASRAETGPLTVVEAMACGTPTVAFRGPGFEDRIEDGVNGLLVEDRPGALAAAMGRVLGDDALRSILAAGALARAGRYSLDAIVDRLVGMYERLLA